MQRWLRMAVMAALAVLLAQGCSEKASQQLASQGGEVPDEVVSDFVTEETDSGRVSWKLTAPKAYRYNARKVFVMDDPRIEFFDEAGMLQTTLTSDNGEYFQDTRDMLAYGDVLVVSVAGDVLETDSLRYLNAEDKIVSDSRVKITRSDGVYTGVGLECDHDLSSVVVKKDVRATIIDGKGKIDG